CCPRDFLDAHALGLALLAQILADGFHGAFWTVDETNKSEQLFQLIHQGLARMASWGCRVQRNTLSQVSNGLLGLGKLHRSLCTTEVRFLECFATRIGNAQSACVRRTCPGVVSLLRPGQPQAKMT